MNKRKLTLIAAIGFLLIDAAALAWLIIFSHMLFEHKVTVAIPLGISALGFSVALLGSLPEPNQLGEPKQLFGLPQFIHTDDAERQGFTIDNHAAGRPLAYKGARFKMTEARECFTELETQLIRSTTLEYKERVDG